MSFWFLGNEEIFTVHSVTCDLRFRPQGSFLLIPPFLHVPRAPLRSPPRAPFAATLHPLSDPPPGLLGGACADPSGRPLLTLSGSRSPPERGGRGLWEKMAAAVQLRVVRVLPMSRKCHWNAGLRWRFRDAGEKCGSGAVPPRPRRLRDTLVVLGGPPRSSFSFPLRLPGSRTNGCLCEAV